MTMFDIVSKDISAFPQRIFPGVFTPGRLQNRKALVGFDMGGASTFPPQGFPYLPVYYVY